MWQLKKTAFCISLIILLHVMTMIVASMDETPYHNSVTNVIACGQILILLFLLVTLITDELIFKRVNRRTYKLLSVGFFFGLAVVCELTCAYLLYHPKSIPKGAFLFFAQYYGRFDMSLIQFDRQFSEYDPQLFYKLKDQESFIHANPEFSNDYKTNSRGFRDDEASLHKPSIIFLGDSYTMGWGSDQNDTYASVVEKTTGLKGLNAGVTSFGTARESILLSSLDTSNLDFIIWQYCFNDVEENKTYVDSGFVLPIRTEKAYDQMVKLHKWNTQYFPGKIFLTILNLFKLSLVAKPNKVSAESFVEQRKHAERFLEILCKTKINWTRTRVIVFELHALQTSTQFIYDLQNLVNERMPSQEFMKKLDIVNIKPILNKDDYYVLDIHLTKQGNFKVGKYLSGIIKTFQNK